MAARSISFAFVVGITAVDSQFRRSLSSIFASSWYNDEIQGIPSEIGCAVAAVWAVQVIGGRFRAEPSWIDRLGRALGVFWIGMIPFAWFDYTT